MSRMSKGGQNFESEKGTKPPAPKGSGPAKGSLHRTGWRRATAPPTKSKLPPLTDFQQAIVRALEKGPNQQLSRRVIAQIAFPEKWKRRQGRGALIGHIDRACLKMPDVVVRLDPKRKRDDPIMSLRTTIRMF